MSDEQMIYEVPENLPLRELKTWLAKNQPATTESAEDVERAYLDTFDWRLFRAGTALEVATRRGGYLLTWRKLGSGEPLIQARMRRVPRFANEFVAPGIRQQLHEILGERSLLPHISVGSRTRSVNLIDDEQKTLVRVELRQDRVVVPNSTRFYKLPDYAYLFRYRGYDAVFRKKRRQLTENGRLQPVSEDPLISALNCLGIQPANYSNKPAFRLDPEQPTHAALKQILDAFRNIMEINIEGLCKDKDPEFLHDYLLALRRTRCLLDRFPSSFPDKGMEIVKQDFEWVENIARPVRNLDIHLGLFEDFGTRVDSDHRGGLKSLQRFLVEQKLKQQRQMRIPMESPRYRRLMDAWQRVLTQSGNGGQYPAAAERPIGQTASEHIWDAYLLTLDNGRAISGESSMDDLLKLYQHSKLLGYQMEIFSSLYPKDKYRPLMAVQKRVQDNLNRLHDLHLQHNALLDYRNRMRQERRTMPISLEAIDLLAADMAEECSKVRADYADRFQWLDRKKTQKRFRILLADNDSDGRFRT